MRFKVIAIEALAIFVSYLVFSLSIASATDVDIMFNGQVQDTAKYEQERIVNVQISVKHEPGDITWTNVKLLVNLNSASLSHSIKKILLYKCRGQTPTECVRSTPQEFDNYADTELLWRDISEKTGSAPYPETANLLFLVKLEDTNNKESWAGFFTQTKRMSYNIFDIQQFSISSIEVHAKSLDLVEPIKFYIENKLMIPFRWATKVVFSNANTLYGMGATAQEADSHKFQTAVVPSNEIANMNKDFYLVSPKISSGIASPITLNLNPSFTCGNNICESDIGESQANCCNDCGCPSGQFCDVPANVNLNSCKNDTMSLAVISASAPLITDCSKSFNANISARVSNPPASLESQLHGTVLLNQSIYSVTCSGSSGSLDCSFPLTSSIKCGGGSFVLGPGLLNLTLNFKDGPNQVSKTLSTSFSGVAVNFDCKCPEGSYCDTVKQSCQSESAITLGITKLTSYLDNYHSGDRIYLNAKVFNPPAGLVLVDKSAEMNLTNGQVSPGTPDCSPPNSQFEYNCTIPFQISGYTNEKAYTFSPNTLFFTITYNDGPLAKTKIISAPFGPVSIPSQSCGDDKCNMGESQDTCCLDCGCPSTTKYCDKVNGCEEQSSVSVSVSSVYPTNFTDCRQSHTVSLGVAVSNAPTDMSLDHFAYLQGGVIRGWNLQCATSSVSTFSCTLVIPPLESEGCSLPYKVVGTNSVNLTLSFPDGKTKQITKHLSAPFQDILVTPVFHCGDNVCESSLLENASNCCFDCPCKDSPSFGSDFFCDFDQVTFLGGCVQKSNIRLVVDSPKAPVNLQSCELTNDVNVQAHIESQPATARPEFFSALLNGSNTDIYCTPQQIMGSSNFTFNCTVRVPSLFICTRGGVYTYDPNSLAILLGFQNGKKTETIAINASLPTITTREGVRTLYDINQDMLGKMKTVLQKTKDIANDLLGEFKRCVDVVKTIAFMTIALAIFGGAYLGSQSGGSVTEAPTMQGKALTTTQKVSIGVANAAMITAAGTSLMQAYALMCQFIVTQYQIALQTQQIEVQMISMEYCLDFQQHLMDTAQCDRNPQTCFSGMVSCMGSFSNIQSATSQITSLMNQGTGYLTQMNDKIATAATQIGMLGTGVYGFGSFQVSCGGATGGECCGATDIRTVRESSGDTYRTCNPVRLEFITSANTGTTGIASTTQCPAYIIRDTTNIGTKNLIDRVFSGDNAIFDDKCHTFTLYCDRNRNGGVDIGDGQPIGSAQMVLKSYVRPGGKALEACTCPAALSGECVAAPSGPTAAGTQATTQTGCCIYQTEFEPYETRCSDLSQTVCSALPNWNFKGVGNPCSGYVSQCPKIVQTPTILGCCDKTSACYNLIQGVKETCDSGDTPKYGSNWQCDETVGKCTNRA